MNILCRLPFKNILSFYFKIFLIYITNIIICNIHLKGSNNNSLLVDQTKININNELNFHINSNNNTTMKEENDLNYILNYKGGILEPEWQWIKNISIVYTWVDGSDINFQDLKSKYNGGIRNVNSRDRSADELRYSIRSLEKYMPWHQGIIYIVTCQQIPKWLNTNHPRIKIVDHKTIFPKYVFPTFDSGTIELFFDKIPGISERFIYFNDDFFLNNYIHPSFFFTSQGFPKIYKSSILSNISKEIYLNNIYQKKNMFKNVCYNTRELIHVYFDKDFQYYYLSHSPYVLYRDLMEPFRQFFKEELKILCIDKFRNWEKFQSLYLYITFIEYSGRENNKLKFYDENKLPNTRNITNYSNKIIPPSISNTLIKYSFVNNNYISNEKRFNFIKNHPEIYIYNFNDNYSKHEVFLEFTEFLITRYPEPSSFEKKEYINLEKLAYSELLHTSISNETIFNKTINNFKKNKKKLNNKIYKLNKKYRLDIIEKYLSRKEELSGPKKDISDREKEEIEFLLHYNGGKLEHEWEWAKSLSIVYIFESFGECNENKKIFEINKLKYSLRSIEIYMPWFKGNIYIIISNEDQKEFGWINTNSERIHLIDQNALLPENNNNEYINRYVLEMYLDKIPGLSERFIYLNSKHFFINYLHPRFFFNKEYFPKYNFENLLPNKVVYQLKETYKSFFNTYKIIMKYFGKHYINSYQYLKNAPYPLYRDLFEPVRQLYKKHVKMLLNGQYSNNNIILPLYLITTYNIYGTNHPYYPNDIGGYGEVRKFKSISLNPSRTIDFYGFDITSPTISNYTMTFDISIIKNTNLMIEEFIYNKTCEKNEIIDEILYRQKLFFSIEEISDIDNFIEIMNYLYNKKSLFEL